MGEGVGSYGARDSANCLDNLFDDVENVILPASRTFHRIRREWLALDMNDEDAGISARAILYRSAQFQLPQSTFKVLHVHARQSLICRIHSRICVFCSPSVIALYRSRASLPKSWAIFSSSVIACNCSSVSASRGLEDSDLRTLSRRSAANASSRSSRRPWFASFHCLGFLFPCLGCVLFERRQAFLDICRLSQLHRRVKDRTCCSKANALAFGSQ